MIAILVKGFKKSGPTRGRRFVMPTGVEKLVNFFF